MKKWYALVLVVTMLTFVFTGCSFFGQKEAPQQQLQNTLPAPTPAKDTPTQTEQKKNTEQPNSNTNGELPPGYTKNPNTGIVHDAEGNIVPQKGKGSGLGGFH
ncbi:Hypothetical protein LUCI_3736 [Lucifera butyrica]|uniref:Lipoprotein n=1 Tax=Lucifera butyrica TaxID=1351585 RepID=A0A498RAA1_9FIRM|nr:hypothetical protein [Lucifera butyrica]VBB08464.1 Hypothetical protein LUCI_3736 [Lucifera butyrica]